MLTCIKGQTKDKLLLSATLFLSCNSHFYLSHGILFLIFGFKHFNLNLLILFIFVFSSDES